MTKPTLPKPPKGFRLIVTEAQKRRANPKRLSDIYWDDGWRSVANSDGVFYRGIYARRIRASKGRVKK
jgi:hypothetical protein